MSQVMEAQSAQAPLADDQGFVTAEKIVSAVDQIVQLAKPLRVVAFGSRARGDHQQESDLDLAVIVEQYDPKKDKRPLWRADLDVWMSVDLIVVGRERYEFMQDSVISLERQIETDGITLYDSRTGSIDCGAAGRLAG